jgi:cytochrome c oxidase subunit 4
MTEHADQSYERGAHGMHAHDHGDHHDHGGVRIYVMVALALLVLTGCSYLTYTPLWPGESIVAKRVWMMGVSCTKAMLVILFFMHLKDHPKLIKVTFGAAFFFFLILVAHTLSDYLSRGGKGMPHFPASGIVSNQ